MADKLSDLADKLDREAVSPSVDTLAAQLEAEAGDTAYIGGAQPGGTERPGPTGGPVASVKRIASRAAEPFEGVDIIPSPQALLDVAMGTAATLDPGLLPRATKHQLMTTSGQHLQEAFSQGFTAIGATYEAAINGFDQFLQELGVSRTQAHRATRELVRLGDFFAFAGPTAPSSTLATKGREVRRTLTGAESRDKQLLELLQEREKDVMARAENIADREAREAARANAPEGATAEDIRLQQDIAAAKAKVGARQTVDDITADALQTDALLHDPERVVDEIPIFTQEVLNQPTIAKAMEAARDVMVMKGRLPEGADAKPERVTQTVIDALADGGLQASELRGALREHGVSDKDFLQMLGSSSTEAGRTLQQFSQFKQWLRTQAFRGDEAAQEMLNDFAERAREAAQKAERRGITGSEAIEPFFRQGGRLFRKLLVSLPSTAVRNFLESWGTRIVLQTSNRALETAAHKLFRPGDPLKEPVNAFDEWYRAITPKGRRLTTKELDAVFGAFPETRHKLWATLEADIAMDQAKTTGRALDWAEAGVDNALLWLNRAQSKLVRGPVFAAELDRQLRKLGVSLEDAVDYGKIPAGFEKALSNAMELALYTDYTLAPTKGPMAKFFRGYTQVLDSLPGGAFFEPFPRFLYNAMKLTTEQMPTAGLRLIKPSERAKIAAGDYDTLAREMTGAMLYTFAYSARKGYIEGLEPGPNWDEFVQEDGTTISMAPYVLFAAPLFLSDLMIRAEEGKLPVDFNQRTFKTLREGLLGRGPQVEYGSAALSDALSAVLGSDSLSGGGQRFLELMGEKVLSGYLRPLQLYRDFGSEIDEAWLVHRETRGQGVFAPATDIFAPEQLPPRHLPTRSDPASIPQVPIPFVPFSEKRISGNIARHVTGTLWREKKNAIENELAEMGFELRTLTAKTGDPFLDNLVAKAQGPALELIGELVVTSPVYIELPTATKREVLRNLVNATRQIGLKYAEGVAPGATLLRKLRTMPLLKREMLFDTLNSIMEGRGDGLTVEGLGDYIIDQLRQAREAEAQRAFEPEGEADGGSRERGQQAPQRDGGNRSGAVDASP